MYKYKQLVNLPLFKIIRFASLDNQQRVFYIGNSKFCVFSIVFMDSKLSFFRVLNNTLINR